jgi:two-component system phosphate regulon sensor histidine kinase PhoR
MARKPFMLQILPAFLLITLLSLLLVSFFVTRTVEARALRQTERDLEIRATLVRAALRNIPEGDHAAIQALCRQLGAETETRITIIEADGLVVADSEESPEQMDPHATRPEVTGALATGRGRALRYSYTVDTRMMYIAVPGGDGSKRRVIRVAVPLDAIKETNRAIYGQLFLLVIGVSAISALLSWLVSRRVMRPLIALKAGAERFARGDFAETLPVPDSEEIASLAESLNEMARECAFRIEAMEQQRNEQDAVFSSMTEGVLAVDSEMRIISMNDTASGMLQVDPNAAKGRPILEVARNMALHDLVLDALQSEEPVEAELTISHGVPRYLMAQGTVLRNGTGQAMGAVIVLNDVTRLRRLEAMRQDFVANVSHELKTPITSIKGFVETLLDEPDPSPENTRRFLQIIEKQANRLDAIIEDLLSLSRLEQTKGASFEIDRASVLPIIEAAVELCRHQADARAIRIQVDCPPDLTAQANPSLLEQGLVNLINNAVKYSDEGQAVSVRAHEEGGNMLIEVIDKGAGIHANELERIFERFYRVDKARSRDLGGTGLGLSIVKHIAQVHAGTVRVASTPGEGSTFTLQLPLDHA